MKKAGCASKAVIEMTVAEGAHQGGRRRAVRRTGRNMAQNKGSAHIPIRDERTDLMQ